MSIIHYNCFFLIQRVPLHTIFFLKTRTSIEQWPYIITSLTVVKINNSCFSLFKYKEMLLYRTPEGIPCFVKCNKSHMLLSLSFYHFYNFVDNVILFVVQKDLFLFNWVNVYRFFNSQSTSWIRFLVSLVKSWWTMKESWWSHTNFFVHWLHRK